jgi:4-hydroxy-4-methyl-2-oxoglutarate aldolase
MLQKSVSNSDRRKQFMSTSDLRIESEQDKVTKDTELFHFIELSLYTAVVSDALDDLGLREQVMREYLRPVHASCRFAGWAHTVACSDVYHTPKNSYDLEIEAVDSIVPGAVVVVSTQQSKRNAPWGELLSTAAKARKARGAVIDGLVRDVKKIEELDFPVLAAGIKPVDSRGRGVVTDYNLPVHCGEVLVNPGDLIFADYDGVVAIPRSMVSEVVRIASDKANRENGSRTELMKGALLRDVYNRFGVL